MPCALEGFPIFTRAHGNELWVMLLEKAYAKLHGSFANIENGHPNEALQDFTGFPTICYDFYDKQIKELINNPDKQVSFFKLMLNFHQEGYLLSATAPGQI